MEERVHTSRTGSKQCTFESTCQRTVRW